MWALKCLGATAQLAKLIFITRAREKERSKGADQKEKKGDPKKRLDRKEVLLEKVWNVSTLVRQSVPRTSISPILEPINSSINASELHTNLSLICLHSCI